MNFKKIFFVSIFSLFIIWGFAKCEMMNLNKALLTEVNNSFNDLINYNFLDKEYNTLALQVGKCLIEMIQDKGADEQILHLLEYYKQFEYKLTIWLSISLVDDELEILEYRTVQKLRLKFVSQLVVHSAEPNYKKYFPKLSKYGKDTDFDSYSVAQDYCLFINNYLKKGSSLNSFFNEKEVDELIDRLIKEKHNVKIELLNSNKINVLKKLFKTKQINILKNKIKIFELFVKTLLKIKVNYLYNKSMQEDFNKIFACNDVSKKMLVVRYYILLTKKEFKKFLDNENLSKIFNKYLDLVLSYFDEQDVLNQSLFIYSFFEVYSSLTLIRKRNKSFFPFKGNKQLVIIIDEMLEVLNLILKKIQEKMGIGPGWLQKMLLGKMQMPEKFINFALNLLEGKLLNKA